ncbi:hypothetical protein [Synechocystis sp. LKSZ1]|uniref:hypothetical protein n=1 Tax=Synechocystis sp. LKSZ1 TaxID=3144951 RepID=UPI00336C0B82
MTDFFLPERQHPIPPPSHPRQFRAIGLVYGQYYPSEEYPTRGVLATEDGAIIEAVMLGKMLSLFKKHLNLSQPHLWIVYPRARDEDNHLHLQLAGIWDPQTLGPGVSKIPLSLSSSSPPLPAEQQKGYFSIRGEVVFVAPAEQLIVVKVRQSPKASGEKASFFKVRIRGTLSARPVGRFWSMEAQLQGQTFVLKSAQDLGFIIRPRSERRPTTPRSFPPQRSRRPLGQGDSLPPRPLHSTAELPKPKPRRPLPKPIKRKTTP